MASLQPERTVPPNFTSEPDPRLCSHFGTCWLTGQQAAPPPETPAVQTGAHCLPLVHCMITLPHNARNCVQVHIEGGGGILDGVRRQPWGCGSVCRRDGARGAAPAVFPLLVPPAAPPPPALPCPCYRTHPCHHLATPAGGPEHSPSLSGSCTGTRSCTTWGTCPPTSRSRNWSTRSAQRPHCYPTTPTSHTTPSIFHCHPLHTEHPQFNHRG